MSVKAMTVVWDSKLPRDEKFILLAYADHADHEGGSIRPSIATIAKKTGYSERQVKRIKQKLLKRKALVIVGKGYHGEDLMQMCMDAGSDILSPAESTEGDISDKKGVTFETEGVTFETEGGDIAVSPEPSLKPSKEPSIKTISAPSAGKNAIRKEVAEYFSETTRIVIPNPTTEKAKRTAGALWYTPIREICDLAEWDIQRAKHLISKAIKSLEKDRCTIASPKSIVNTCVAIDGAEKRGIRSDEPAGFSAIREYMQESA